MMIVFSLADTNNNQYLSVNGQNVAKPKQSTRIMLHKHRESIVNLLIDEHLTATRSIIVGVRYEV